MIPLRLSQEHGKTLAAEMRYGSPYYVPPGVLGSDFQLFSNFLSMYIFYRRVWNYFCMHSKPTQRSIVLHSLSKARGDPSTDPKNFPTISRLQNKSDAKSFLDYETKPVLRSETDPDVDSDGDTSETNDVRFLFMSGVYWERSRITQKMKVQREKSDRTFLGAGVPVCSIDVELEANDTEEYIRLRPNAIGEIHCARP